MSWHANTHPLALFLLFSFFFFSFSFFSLFSLLYAPSCLILPSLAQFANSLSLHRTSDSSTHTSGAKQTLPSLCYNV